MRRMKKLTEYSIDEEGLRGIAKELRSRRVILRLLRDPSFDVVQSLCFQGTAITRAYLEKHFSEKYAGTDDYQNCIRHLDALEGVVRSN